MKQKLHTALALIKKGDCASADVYLFACHRAHLLWKQSRKLESSWDMRGALWAVACVLVGLGVHLHVRSALATVHHGLQPPWAGGVDDEASEGLESRFSCTSLSSGGLGPLLRSSCKSKDDVGHTSTKQVGQEGPAA